MPHAHQTCGRALLAEGAVARHLLFEQFDDRLGRIVPEKQAEVGFVVVDEAAEGGDVDLAKVRVHYVLDWQVEYLLE